MYEIDTGDQKPIYLQIVDQIKDALVRGYYKDGDKIPSVRDLASKLLINNSTVVKAYNELERQGIIKSEVGRGTFISLDEEKIKKNMQPVRDDLKRVFSRALYLGLEEEEILDIYKSVKKEFIDET